MSKAPINCTGHYCIHSMGVKWLKACLPEFDKIEGPQGVDQMAYDKRLAEGHLEWKCNPSDSYMTHWHGFDHKIVLPPNPSAEQELTAKTITLQRDSFGLGGNIRQLTIGKLPEGVSNNSLTWVPVRLYSQEQGGIPSSSNSPNEHYPLFWEVPIDEVILNRQTLPKPNLNDSIGYTALINSGTSTLHGPQKTVQALYSALSTDIDNSNSSTGPSYNCTRPIELTYVIGGKQFPVDPRDMFGFQNLDPRQDDNDGCHIISVGSTNAPSTGNLRSWILGDPFMKSYVIFYFDIRCSKSLIRPFSNLVAFYFGNVTHPSVDPPRIGFLSTVPSNASALFDAAIEMKRQKGVAGSLSSLYYLKHPC
ncbi:hypothetical protein M422DRAFT_239298 [Sphaerobolus stellatus SS14]|nr:hypothetical protein M422DRAFT_239298 [Sphaerobolus stellatus SS14]